MDLKLILGSAIAPGLALLPPAMTSPRALVMLLTIGQQESGMTARVQHGGGPARGLWQFEEGGGVRGVLMHPATQAFAVHACQARDVLPTTPTAWAALARDDVLAAAFARLLLFADPRPLPELGDEAGAWECYARNWRPGKPRRETWGAFYAAALHEVPRV